MFDQPLLLEQIQNSIITAQEAVYADLAQPESHLSVLLIYVRLIPDEWESETKQLIARENEPPLEEILQAISIDIENTGEVPSRLWTYQSLLRLAILVYSMKHHHRSSGPSSSPASERR